MTASLRPCQRLRPLQRLEAAVAEGRIKGLARGLAWRLARTNAQLARVEQSLADASRLLEHLSLTSEWYSAQIQAILQARLEPFLLVSADRTIAEMNPAARALFPPPAAIGQ